MLGFIFLHQVGEGGGGGGGGGGGAHARRQALRAKKKMQQGQQKKGSPHITSELLIHGRVELPAFRLLGGRYNPLVKKGQSPFK